MHRVTLHDRRLQERLIAESEAALRRSSAALALPYFDPNREAWPRREPGAEPGGPPATAGEDRRHPGPHALPPSKG